MIYFCCEEGRRILVRDHPSLNGIDYLEVVHHEEANVAEQQRTLRVNFVKPQDTALQARFGTDSIANATQVKVTGQQGAPHINVDSAVWVEVGLDGRLEVHVTPRGDYSRFTLSLVEPNTDEPLANLDPILAAIDFSFKVECESDFDCRPACACPPKETSAPDLDYLAKDFTSFRQLMLDRIALLAPQWRERNPADLGITLVELLAYVGDYLSYRQDAVATEAYLGTALRRVSLRRHTRLLDYAMHDGCNARAWVQVRLKPESADGVVLMPDGPTRPRFVTRLKPDTVLAEHEFQSLAAAGGAVIFEPLERVELFREHNDMFFYTWGESACCLPKGATKATLRGEFPNLQPGHVVIFVEQIGPQTGDSADADPNQRHAVRLTKINGLNRDQYLKAKQSGTLPQTVDPLFDPPIKLTEIEWAETDALPLPICVSSRAASDGRLLENVSVAIGNIVLADHGLTLPQAEEFDPVPSPNPVLAPVSASDCGPCEPPERLNTPPRFRPQLKARPLTQAAGYDHNRPAAEAFQWEMQEVFPSIELTDNQGRLWRPQRDLLSSDAFAPEFVAEVESDGRTHIRFGDDEGGLAPGEGTQLGAVYRIGNGASGNLGAQSLVNLVAENLLVPDVSGELRPQPAESLVESVSNPLPARGGTDPEPMEEARQNAPAAFRVQQRAVTPDDYAQKAALHPEVQRAAATLRWTGSWHTVFLTVDRRNGRKVDGPFEKQLQSHLERFRLAGHDLKIDGPSFVPLELEIRVCVRENFFQSDVAAALLRLFDNRQHADGSRGFFHPDNFTFGQPVLMSRIYAAAMRVDGVRHVEITLLRRQGDTTGEAFPESDVFEIGRLEIARLDNDPNFPDRGVLRINSVGGRQ